MALSHANCSHPSTSSARAACRKAQEGGMNRKAKIMTGSNPKPQSKKTRAKRETDATVEAEKIIKAAKSKAYRTASAQALHPRPQRGDCYVCGSSAAHAERKTGQPVCMKHIDDWDQVVILPL